jgi:hypothetical protein
MTKIISLILSGLACTTLLLAGLGCDKNYKDKACPDSLKADYGKALEAAMGTKPVGDPRDKACDENLKPFEEYDGCKIAEKDQRNDAEGKKVVTFDFDKMRDHCKKGS